MANTQKENTSAAAREKIFEAEARKRKSAQTTTGGPLRKKQRIHPVLLEHGKLILEVILAVTHDRKTS